MKDREDLRELYKSYMQELFNKYGEYEDYGNEESEKIPIEDARYILPYSYHSNLIMGCDARELFNITSDLIFGKNSNIIELKQLGIKLRKYIIKNVPYLKRTLKKEGEKDYYEDKLNFLDKKIESKGQEKLIDKVHILDFTYNGDWKVICQAIETRYNISHSAAEKVLCKLLQENPNIETEIIQAIKKSKNQRELESVIYTFEIPISLAVLTHITRHRMHSLMVPDFVPLNNLDNYITPETIARNHKEEYDEIYKKNKEMVEYFKNQGVMEEDLVYFYLSGNALNISTTMNAKCLEWFSRMRCCDKAQWEIRNIANEMVKLASYATPIIGTCYGPSCKVLGKCPEARDNCKTRGVVIKKKVLEKPTD